MDAERNYKLVTSSRLTLFFNLRIMLLTGKERQKWLDLIEWECAKTDWTKAHTRGSQKLVHIKIEGEPFTLYESGQAVGQVYSINLVTGIVKMDLSRADGDFEKDLNLSFSRADYGRY